MRASASPLALERLHGLDHRAVHAHPSEVGVLKRDGHARPARPATCRIN
jgi:hypothetical protein